MPRRRAERIRRWAARLDAASAPFLWYETVRQFKGRNNGSAPPTKSFNKIGTLAAFRLDPTGNQLQIGYSWYRYGTVAERLPHQITRSEDPESGRPLTDWIGPAPAQGSEDPMLARIRESVAQVLADYPSESAFERMVDEVYEYAPFPFQKSFRLARMKLGLTGHGSRFEPELRALDFWTLFNGALVEFPEQDFPLLAVQVGPLRELTKLTWQQLPGRDRETTRRLVEAFWDTFSTLLRTHQSGHSRNLSRELLASRATDSSYALDRLKSQFGDATIELKTVFPEVGDDATLGPILEARERELDDQDDSIREALTHADDIQRLINEGS